MSSEVARSGVKHPGPRTRVACPATHTILYQGLGFLGSFSFAVFLLLGDVMFAYIYVAPAGPRAVECCGR